MGRGWRVVLVLCALAGLGADGCFDTSDPEPDPCAGYATCGACTGLQGCGWCPSAGTCSSKSIEAQSECYGNYVFEAASCPNTPVGCAILCPAGTTCNPTTGACVQDVAACARTSCPSDYTWQWMTGGGGSRATCCIDLPSSGATCGQLPAAGLRCMRSGGESPSDQTVAFAPATTMRCALPLGTVTCPALYIGQGASGGTTTAVYMSGCCASSATAAFCGVVASCGGSGACCAPPSSNQMPVR